MECFRSDRMPSYRGGVDSNLLTVVLTMRFFIWLSVLLLIGCSQEISTPIEPGVDLPWGTVDISVAAKFVEGDIVKTRLGERGLITQADHDYHQVEFESNKVRKWYHQDTLILEDSIRVPNKPH